MVNSVGFSGSYANNLGQYSNDIENIAKYAVGSSIVKESDSPFSFGGMILFPALFETPKVIKWIKDAKKSEGGIKGAWAEVVDKYKTGFEKAGEQIKSGALKDKNSYRNVWQDYSAKTVTDVIPNAEKMEKMVEKGLTPETKAIYEKAGKWAERAQKADTTAAKIVYTKHADDFLITARKAATKELAEKEATGFFSKIAQKLGQLTHLSNAKSVINEFAAKSPLTAKLLKFGKASGAGLNAIIEGGMEMFTQVIPSFTQLGVGSGLKQLGKSTVKVAASVGGWTAGAALGAAIGSVIPGAGTVVGGVIGSVIGMAGGMIGSWGATKFATALVGKNELDIAKEKEAKKLAEQAEKDSQAAQQLFATAKQKLETEGVQSQDAQIAFNSYKKLAGSQQSSTGFQYNPSLSQSNPFNNNANGDFMAMASGITQQ